MPITGPYNIRIRILILLVLLSLICLGAFLIFEKAQRNEYALYRQQRMLDVSERLQRLIGSVSMSPTRFLRKNANNASLAAYLTRNEGRWTKNFLNDRMDFYHIDHVWVLRPDGSVLFVNDRHAQDDHSRLPLEEMQPLLQQGAAFRFYLRFGEGLHQIQGMPVLERPEGNAAPRMLGWLVVASHWDEFVLLEMAESGHGRILLTGPQHQGDTRSEEELEAWHPLVDHRGQTIAGLDYHVIDSLAVDPELEIYEFSVFVLSNIGMVALTLVLLHFWILRPFLLVRESLASRNPELLIPLIDDRTEFGEMARTVQASLRGSAQLEQNLKEREQLARALHDGVIQGIYAAGMSLNRLPALMERDASAARQSLEEIRTALNLLINDLRGYIDKVDPRPTEPSFSEAVRRLLQQLHGPDIPLDVRIDDTLAAALPPMHRNQVLLLVREAASNALRHGMASRLTVSWQQTPEGSVLEVWDNGKGFDPATNEADGRGLSNLHERALSLGGRLRIDSHPHKETRICLVLPSPRTSA